MGTTQSRVSRIERQPDIHLSTLHEYVEALGGRLRLVVEHEGSLVEIEMPSVRERRRSAGRRREYRVIWQDHATRALVPVGWLEFTGDEFVFSYTDDARSHEDFQPFPPFPRFDVSYRSNELFPFFSVRLTNAADPEFDVLIDALGLTRDDATPAELLARSPSVSPHDTIQVIPEPTELEDGTLVRTFLVSGVRHIDEGNLPLLSQTVSRLEKGDALELVPEPGNPKNPRALRLATGGRPVGWVPDYLVEEVHAYREANRGLSFSVERANGEDAPWHLRLLCRLVIAPPAH